MPRRLSSILPAALLFAAASPAAAEGYYRAEPAAQPSSGRVVSHGLVWKCEGGACVAGRSRSRAAVDCQALVREIGALRSFAVEGQALAPDQLEKCNARAR